VSFNTDGNCVNPSRAHPDILSFSSPLPPRNRRVLRLLKCPSPDHPALLFSLICVTDSSLLEPSPQFSKSKPSKFITGILLPYEWERMSALLCMVFRVPSMHAPLIDGKLTFSTKPVNDGPCKSPTTSIHIF
jgi:hypothetical protein